MNKVTNIYSIRKHLKCKIIFESEIVDNFTTEKELLQNILKLSVLNGESQSVLLIGPRGSGKSIVLKSVLMELDEEIDLKSNSIKIKLNGLVHTDDKFALKSITNQMNLQNVVGGKVFSTFSENLAFLLDSLQTGDKKLVKSLIFIIEEFDLFCFHDNQTLLYNLLDMTNYSQIPICVVGITSRLDVIELFEKRVKSRFSHRVLNIYPGSFEKRLEMAQNLLMINESVANKNFVKNWNKRILHLINSVKFQNAMKQLYETTKCQRVFKNILLQVVSKLDDNTLELNEELFTTQIDNYISGYKAQILNCLSILELCLIVAMYHHCEIFDNQPFNFEMILERFTKFANEYNKSFIVLRSVIKKAYEHIKNLELISPVSGNSSKRSQSDHELYNLTLHRSQLTEIFKGKYGPLPTEIKQWFDTKLT